MDRFSSTRGVTLLELIIVMAILAILVTLSSLGTDLIQRERVRSATRELLADLQRLRIDAMTRDARGAGIRFESSGSYVLFQFNDCNQDGNYDHDTCGGDGREEANAIVRTMPKSVILRKTNLVDNINGEVCIFDRFGTPRQKTGGFGIMTIIVRNERDPKIVRCVKLSVNRVIEGRWTGTKCNL